jgi:excisionase family DNA binding protein
MDKKLLTRKELAERYGVNVETVSRWVRRGCPVRRASAYRSPMRFDADEVDAWLKEPKTPA